MGRLLLLLSHLEELAQNANYDANKLAKLCGMSPRQLRRHFRQEFQRPPQSWLDSHRMKLAKEMLLAGDSVKKVAIELGFKHASHFCRKFKRLNNMTSSEFVMSQMRSVRRS